MPTIEKNALLQSKDENGNTVLEYPITYLENVLNRDTKEGLDKILAWLGESFDPAYVDRITALENTIGTINESLQARLDGVL